MIKLNFNNVTMVLIMLFGICILISTIGVMFQDKKESIIDCKDDDGNKIIGLQCIEEEGGFQSIYFFNLFVGIGLMILGYYTFEKKEKKWEEY